MEFTKEELKLENSLKKEWLLTNGIGGFASSTIIGANTRKYHGLLIAPLTPPGRRHLILSKVDESIEIDGEKHNLYTNVGENYISQGYKYQEKFKKDYFPVYTYKVGEVKITKIITMEHAKNTVCIYYKVKNGNKYSKMTLAPIINYRDFHTMNTNHIFEVKQDVKKSKVKIILDNMVENPIYLNCQKGKYIEYRNDIYKDMFYIEEDKRGFYPKENHSVPGIYEIEILPNEEKEISLICSLEENIDEKEAKKVINDEIIRLTQNINKTGLIDISNNKKDIETIKNDELIKQFILATEQFIVYRPTFRLHTLIAGYPWFLDWGRDSLISFEGILLITKRYDIAREVLLTMIRDIKYGLVPNGYSGFDNRPLYNSVDASLLLFEQAKKYINYTGDYTFVNEKMYKEMEKVIENYIQGIDLDDNNIYLDTDYLLVSGTPNTQNTWMDAKVDGYAVTPRNGKAVEINSLWYNSLIIMSELAANKGEKMDAKRYKELARMCRNSFIDKFYNPKRKCLYDVLGDNKIRPNQLFALSLSNPIIEENSEMAYNIINTVEKKLLNKMGLKTLAKGEANYVDIYEGNSFKRDMSYHQGITWPWLLGLYYNSLKNMIKIEKRKTYKIELEEKINKLIKTTKEVFSKEISKNGCIGSIAEIYDSKRPQEPKGAFAQCWSVAEIFRIINNK